MPSAASFTSIPSVNNYIRGVLGETNLYASVIPLELKSDERSRNQKVLGDFNYLAPVIPLELKQQQSLVLGDNQNSLLPLEPEPTTRRKASGWLERYTKTKKLKGGAIATYPRVEGERDSDNSEHWYWMWRYELKDSSAASSRGYCTKAFHIEISKVLVVKSAIAQGLGIDQILSIIRS